ncbi:ribosomal protein S8e [Hypoxylon sp. EC38]|nr:ribosomal protein S8e [Hypoxylon sp. EC38]
MGISRDSRHKRSASGAKRAFYRKKRAFEAGRQEANTRIGPKRIHTVRTRGGNHKRQQKSGKEEEPVKKSKAVEKKQAARYAAHGKVESALEKQFEAGRLYAVIASRPGQSGRCDGYILEGEELAFYQRKLHK